MTSGSVPEVLEAEGHREILRAHGGDDRLEVVPVLARNADFFTLNLGGDLEFGVADKGGDLFGDNGFDALFYFDHLARVAERGKIRLAFIDVLEADAAFGQFADDDFHQ